MKADANGVVESFFQTVKYEHLYRIDVPTGHVLAVECAACRATYNEVRPHEHLDFEVPLTAYLRPPDQPPEPNLFRAKTVQKT